MTGIDAQGHTILFSQVAEDGLFLGGGGVFPQRPNAAVGIAADEVVGVKFDYRGGNHIQKFLDSGILLW